MRRRVAADTRVALAEQQRELGFKVEAVPASTGRTARCVEYCVGRYAGESGLIRRFWRW